MVIAGDFDRTEARRLVQQYFGPIPRGGEVPRRPTPAPVVLERERRVDVEAGVELPRIYLAWPTPKYFAPGDAELDIVANLLTHGASSRLFRRLVREQQIASSVSAFQSSMELASMFIVTVTGRPGQSPEALLRATDAELDALRTQPPGADEFERARIDLTTSLLFSIESISNRADRLNLYRQHVGEPDYLARDIGRYNSATPEDIPRTLQSHLPKDRRVVLFVHPTPGAPVSGRVRRASRRERAQVVHFDDDTITASTPRPGAVLARPRAGGAQ
jgi:zinc protease